MEEEPKYKVTINVLYGILVFSTILGFMPTGNAQMYSILLWLLVWGAAYYYRRKDTEDGLLYNHMTYLIGTIGIGTTVIFIGMLVAGLWIFMKGDPTAINAMVAQMMNGSMMSEDQMNAAMNQAMADNAKLMWTASFVAIGPAVLYFVYRVANGLGRAAKGYRIANPKSWL